MPVEGAGTGDAAATALFHELRANVQACKSTAVAMGLSAASILTTSTPFVHPARSGATMLSSKDFSSLATNANVPMVLMPLPSRYRRMSGPAAASVSTSGRSVKTRMIAIDLQNYNEQLTSYMFETKNLNVVYGSQLMRTMPCRIQPSVNSRKIDFSILKNPTTLCEYLMEAPSKPEILLGSTRLLAWVRIKFSSPGDV